VKFLLDENLSPKVAKHLERQWGRDAVHIRGLGQAGLEDKRVSGLAARHGRIVITLDSDFSELSRLAHPPPPGVLWLHPSPFLRSVEGHKKLLDRFFAEDLYRLDPTDSVIEITDAQSSLKHRLR